MDFTNLYNTPLPPGKLQDYVDWAHKVKQDPDTGRYDYDLQGAYLAGVKPDPKNLHLPDQFKKPNHPTFSTESKYSGRDGYVGGVWQPMGQSWSYQPSQTNLNFHPGTQLQQYFNTKEPNSLLVPSAPQAPQPQMPNMSILDLLRHLIQR